MYVICLLKWYPQQCHLLQAVGRCLSLTVCQIMRVHMYITLDASILDIGFISKAQQYTFKWIFSISRQLEYKYVPRVCSVRNLQIITLGSLHILYRDLATAKSATGRNIHSYVLPLYLTGRRRDRVRLIHIINQSRCAYCVSP